ncbi:hypothetical protein EMIHUDRAFT_246535 [Emiliania huxleyi CCMP1516]|uniref:VTT domain-containing protein n=2 Tax=Emiliania huxleyi TaxID=2903 RepID=A0A0D3IRT7_EMIH1|nr:hypothetical protein EMIHUDRAFT_246535 [Emiliania huxleyi CCMP1516]EOD13972.1 hypothetical protein EMIHUDRAFT_246535 [Emiliania huxleyi CCMP1516]|eukprot:XP_005766401.1 hypothetical protein EMIHUDRAFT_246535 [Emiliania huxleyi CCMP1516]
MLGSVSAKLAMLDSAVQSLGPFAAPVYALSLVVSGMIPLPAFNVLVLGAGSLFGVTLGFGVVYPAALAGASLGFFLGRRMPASLRRRIPQKLTMLQGALADGGFTTLLLLRLTPLPFAPSNLFLGSIPAVPFGTYIAATALGFLRLCVNVLIGSRVRGMIDGEGTALEQGLVAGGALTFALALGNICRMLLKRKAAESKQEE